MRGLILGVIAWEVIQECGKNCWQSRQYILKDRLNLLRPSTPEDGTVGFIAFDVPGKDRKKLKTGRFLTRKLGLNHGFLSDKSISMIANEINTEFFPDMETELVNGKQITAYYEDEIGAVSCMTPSGDGGGPECTRLYEMNPGRFQMLAMFYMNDSARAIVHKLDNGRYLLDRVFASNEMLKEKMRDYARANDWWYRETDDADDSNVVCDGNESELVVSGLTYREGCVPYLDTLSNGCTCSGNLTISRDGCCDYELTNTDGSLQDGCRCENCGEHIAEEDMYCVDGLAYCEYCQNDLFGYCEDCGDFVPLDEIVLVADTGDSRCANHAGYQCEDCGDYNQDDYAVIEDQVYCYSCVEKYPVCDGCGEQSIDQDFLDGDGKCVDCRPEEDVVSVSNRRLNSPENYEGQGELDYEG